MILLIAESRDGQLNPASLEALSAARQLQSDITAVVFGADSAPAAVALERAPLAEIVRVEHAALAVYTPGATIAALAEVIASVSPSYVVAAHTYQARDYVGRLAARLDRAIVVDCSRITTTGDGVTFSRPIHQGKAVADVVLDGPAPHFVTTQIGAFSADARPDTAPPVPVRVVTPALNDAAQPQAAEAPFREDSQDVNLAGARRIVAAGRGVKEEAQLDVVRRLASALGAEIAASRPLCDAGWIPMNRQIGSSGQTVAPELYIALGISGAIQHIVGMKGSRTIVAVNKDASAPIFEIADYGIVGDLFEIVPALIGALEAR
jgi:electron transfer flavoprotein alpha subunit